MDVIRSFFYHQPRKKNLNLLFTCLLKGHVASREFEQLCPSHAKKEGLQICQLTYWQRILIRTFPPKVYYFCCVWIQYLPSTYQYVTSAALASPCFGSGPERLLKMEAQLCSYLIYYPHYLFVFFFVFLLFISSMETPFGSWNGSSAGKCSLYKKHCIFAVLLHSQLVHFCTQMYHAEKAHEGIGFGLLRIHIVYNCLRHIGGARGREPFTTAEIYVRYLAAVSLTWPHWSITSGDEWPCPCDGTSNSHWFVCLLFSFCLHPPLAKSETSKDCRKNLTLVQSELALSNAFCLSISLHHCAGCP